MWSHLQGTRWVGREKRLASGGREARTLVRSLVRKWRWQWKKVSFYVGFTRQPPRNSEWCRFLAQAWRPTSDVMRFWGHRGNRPVLVKKPQQSAGYGRVRHGKRKRREWCEGDHLWGSEMVELFGFRHVEVYSSSFLGNALIVEALLQQQFQRLRLVYGRLWRRYTDNPCHIDTRRAGICRVFATWSTKVGTALRAKELKVMK